MAGPLEGDETGVDQLVPKLLRTVVDAELSSEDCATEAGIEGLELIMLIPGDML